MKMSGIHKLPKTIVQKVSQMNETDWTAWATIRSGNPDLQSPYFHPDYTYSFLTYTR